MAELPILPLKVGSLLGDTYHLSAEQFGAYCRILFTMWSHGGRLTSEASQLARIAGVSAAKWKAMSEVVLKPMTIIEGTMSQKRLTDTWLEVQERRKRRADAAGVRWGSKGHAMHEQSNAIKRKLKKKVLSSDESEVEGRLQEATEDEPEEGSFPISAELISLTQRKGRSGYG